MFRFNFAFVYICLSSQMHNYIGFNFAYDLVHMFVIPNIQLCYSVVYHR